MLEHVLRELGNQTWVGDEGCINHADRQTVWLGFSHGQCADRAAAAWAIFNHHLLAKLLSSIG